ncbi:MAG: glycosyltransferase family 2 protein [Aphanocapsa lilacina HA4352-LM1]|jgi:glycosyltransferase involved in cell wall biosynthesis|nr:glycosyltransferase family 2 protein [Aphanocapsa lilacina HA4352-LM1]
MKSNQDCLKRSALGEVEPLVSVIICNFNYSRYVGQAIESVLKQTYRSFEIIVVDDASTDNSRAVIGSFRDKVKPIFLETNSGQGEAFNVGFHHSRGEIICFLDSDDYYHEHKLKKVVRAFHEHPDWLQISHTWTIVDSENAVIGQGPKSFVQGDVCRMLLSWGRYPCAITSGLCYRRVVLQQVLPVPNRQIVLAGRSFNGGADTYLVATVPFYGQVGYVSGEPLMYYRIHGKNRRSRSGNFDHALASYRAVAEFVNRAAEKHGFAGRYNLESDGQYLAMLALNEGVRTCSAWRMVALTLQEALETQVRPRDVIGRLLRRVTCVVSPEQGRNVWRLGLRRFLRAKLFTPLADTVGDSPTSRS